MNSIVHTFTACSLEKLGHDYHVILDALNPYNTDNRIKHGRAPMLTGSGVPRPPRMTGRALWILYPLCNEPG
jgi:hypothetical protein